MPQSPARRSLKHRGTRDEATTVTIQADIRINNLSTLAIATFGPARTQTIDCVKANINSAISETSVNTSQLNLWTLSFQINLTFDAGTLEVSQS